MEALISAQTEKVEAIKKFSANYKKDPKVRKTKFYFANKISVLCEHWSDFKQNHKDIIKLKNEFPEKCKEYFEEDIYGTIEEFYVILKSQLEEDKVLLCPDEKKDEENSGKTVSEKSGSTVRETVIEKIVEKGDVHLPRINIPKFSGEYKSWMSFHDLYSTLIHNNAGLSKVQKLHYLKSSLQGEAEELIRHFTITDGNYEPAWKLLQERYDNKRILIKTQLKTLLSQSYASAETALNIRKLMDTTNECIQALKNLNVNTDDWDIIITYIVSERLPTETKRRWEQEIGGQKEFPTYDKLKQFLETQFRALESFDNKGSAKALPKKHTFHTSNNVYVCALCSGPHSIRQCSQFLNLDHNGRRNVVIKKHLCSNCLSKGHISSACPSRSSCFKCKYRHHTLLHDETTIAQKSNQTRLDNNDIHASTASNATASSSTSLHSENKREVLLATAMLKIVSDSGHEITVRALIDQGSQSTFISETIAQRLHLKGTRVHTTIMGLGNIQAGIVKNKVSITLASLNNSNHLKADALVLGSLTGLLPSNLITKNEHWAHLEGLTLADPKYYLPGRIDMIIGADIYCKIIRNGLKVGSSGVPIAQNTMFGWILSGEISNEQPKIYKQEISSSFHGYEELNHQVRKFWEIEEISDQMPQTVEEKACEEFYGKTTRRLPNGRYVVRLPFKETTKKPPFGMSRGLAMSRFKYLETKFAKSEILQNQYSTCMQEYINLNHMVPAASAEIENRHQDKNGHIYYTTNYLPHHAVYKDSTTTKLRVVFDASHKTLGGPSLNETLMTGPKIQDDLIWILLRWRKHQVVVTADIEKMYRQIAVDDEDAEYQRVLWRNSPDEPIEDFKLQTVTFGTTSAPFLAIRTLWQLANDEQINFPLAAEIVRSDFYVDDLLTGSNSVEECIRLQQELISLLKSGGFNLRKWISNAASLLENIPKEDREISGVREFNMNESVKTLGIIWYPKFDYFSYKLSVKFDDDDSNVTKRKFLSDISKLFDPLGFLSPFLVKLKILMQALWIRETGWDEKIPTDILQIWNKTKAELKYLEHIKIPRWLHTTAADVVEMHGFSDGSLQAYAAVLYVRIKDPDGNIKISLLSAKTKVTPIKQISLPRIELCGALLLARLFKAVKKAMKFEKISCYAWTDSTIVLSWLQGQPCKYKTFVGNRVAEIQSVLCRETWNHVPSNSNPADCATRGLLPKELLSAKMWWNGPDWLQKSKEFWPSQLIVNDTDLEVKKIRVNLAKTYTPSNLDLLISRFSSLTKLIRVTAYCFRFLAKQRPETKWLTTAELNTALRFWIKKTQSEIFEDEIVKIKTNSLKNGKLKCLNPFLDQDGILRVGGRLQNIKGSWNQKHPIILPNSHPLVTLIIANMHQQTLHGGAQLMINLLRQNYWILNIRNAVKHYIHKCTTCFRLKAKYQNQLMGSLPQSRAQISRPFAHVGIDYCGPIEIKSSKLRNAKMQKAYLAIFICMATRAMHIEVVSDLTTQAFVAALKRFIGRRGFCTDIYSDNATNFVGTRNLIKEEFEKYLHSLHKELPDIVSHYNVNWHFIPPASPHFGGLWEAGVKSTKFHLKRILGNSRLTFEELTTTVVQIEACLNSRPLYPLTNDPDDIDALTPGHFLVGGPLLSLPEQSYINQNIHRLNRWQYMQQLMQSFWKRWQSEYLNSLQQRPKWASETKNIEVGDLVLIREDGLPPCKWALARVLETHPGSDGLVRVVTLKTKDSTYKRAITKICLLPINDPIKE